MNVREDVATRSRGTGAWIRAAILGTLAVMLGLMGLLRNRLPVLEYYTLLSLPAINLTSPIGDVADSLNIPLLSALLFGLIGAISPCQLSTNLAAFAWVSRETGDPATRVVSATAAYLLGKVLVYSLVGLAAIGLGLQLEQASVPVIVMARKALGPLMLLIGLFLLGVLRLEVSVGDRLGGWFERRAEGRGRLGAFLLGVAFSFAFCPTLFWLFFGLTIPLALASGGGPAYPAVFALGTTLPVVVAALLLALGLGSRGQLVQRTHRMNRFLQPAIGLVFVLVGLNDTLLYWFI